MNLDRTIQEWIHSHQQPSLHHFASGLSQVTSPRAVILWAALSAIILWFLRRRRDAASLFLGTILGCALITPLKILFHRTRPIYGLMIHSYSFPSGHALASTIFFCLLAASAGRIDLHHRTLYGLLALILILLVGASRIYLRVHWPSDVIGGYFFGTIFLCLWEGILFRHADKH